MADSQENHLPWVPSNFLALPIEQSRLDRSRVVLIPVPYDSTTSFRSGARDGPAAIIEASGALEDYDWELDLDVSALGIHTTPALEPHVGDPELMVQRVRSAVSHYVRMGKVVGVLGGEHSVTIGSVQAQLEAHSDLSVLYLDAHADLRDEYLGTRWGHASGARRIHELCPVVLVGVRSMCQEEREYLQQQALPVFYWPSGSDNSFIQQAISHLGSAVYVSIDLDVFDPSLMAAVGTPEPGGAGWYEVMSLLKALGESRRVVGFDISELAPDEGPRACAYTAAKLTYKLIAYSLRLSAEHPAQFSGDESVA